MKGICLSDDRPWSHKRPFVVYPDKRTKFQSLIPSGREVENRHKLGHLTDFISIVFNCVMCTSTILKMKKQHHYTQLKVTFSIIVT